MTPQEELEYLRLKKRKAQAMSAPSAPGPEIGPMNQTVQMPFTVQQMPMDARRDWMEANAPNAITQPQRPKMGMGEAATMGVVDMGMSLPVVGDVMKAPLKAGGMTDQKIDQTFTDALEDRPVSHRLGQAVGLAAGGGASLWMKGERALAKAGAKLSPALGVTSKSIGDKAIRYGGRLGGLGFGGLLENAAFNTFAEGRNQNRQDTGESQGMGDIGRGLEVAKDDAFNPIAAVAPAAASGIFRAGKYVKSGGQSFTPDAVAARVDQALTPSSGQTLPATLVGAIDPAAERQLVRLLSNEGGFGKDDITAALTAFEQSIEGGMEGAALASRLKDVLSEQLGERARKPIDDFLQGAGNRKGGESGRIVGETVAEDAPRLSQFLEDSANSRFGSASRFDTAELADQEMARIGQEGYERVLSKPMSGITENPDSLSWGGPTPSEPQGLLGFIRQQGGLKESFGQDGRGYMRGTVEGILGDVRKRPGLLNNKTGKTLDQLRRDAQDAGFDIPDDDAFIRALGDELQSGQKNHRIGEAEEWQMYQDFLAEQGGRSDRYVPTGADERLDDLKAATSFYANSPLARPLKEVAAGKMMDLDAFIEADPRRAAHWMQHTASLKAQQAADSGDMVTARAYGEMRQNILDRLEADGVAPGYKEARKQFGDEYTNKRALNFGDRFITASEDQMKLGKLLKEMEGMTPTEREAAFLSIRDAVLRPAMRRTEGGLPRMAIIGREPVLNALERLGPEGTAFANDVRKTAERVQRTQQIDPRTGSNTMNKQEAAQFAEKSVANPLVRALGNTMQNMGGDAAISGATGVFSPVMTGRALLRKGGDMLANGRQGKIDALTELLTRDVGSAPRAPMSGDPTAGPANVFAGGQQSVQQAPAQQGANVFAPVRAGGMAGLRSDAGNAAIGGAIGGVHPDFDGDGEVTAGERIKGVAIGAGGVAALRGGAAYKRGLDNSVSRSVRSQVPPPARGHRGPISINAYERAYEQAVAQTGIRKANDPKNHAVAIDLLTNAGFSREYADNIIAENMRALDRAALKQGGGLRVVGNDEPPVSGMGFSGGKPPPIKPDVPLGKGPKNGNRLGRGLEDLVREQNAPRIPKPPPMEPRRPSNALAAQDAPPAKPVERDHTFAGDHSLNLGGPEYLVLGGAALGGSALAGKQVMDDKKSKREEAARYQQFDGDPANTRAMIEMRMMEKISDGKDTSAKVERERLAMSDRILEMEAQSASRPRGTPQQEALRAKILKDALYEIAYGRPHLVDDDLRRLGEIDRAISGAPQLPTAPSMKPTQPNNVFAR